MLEIKTIYAIMLADEYIAPNQVLTRHQLDWLVKDRPALFECTTATEAEYTASIIDHSDTIDVTPVEPVVAPEVISEVTLVEPIATTADESPKNNSKK